MSKIKTGIAFGLIALATAVLAVTFLNSYKYHWMEDGMPLSICFWALLSVSFTFNGIQVGKLVMACRAFALLLLGAGIVSFFVAMPDKLAQAVQILCFVTLGAICLTSIFNTFKDRKAKKAQAEAPAAEEATE